MAADQGMLVRIAANVADLKQALAEGKNEIVVTTAAMTKLASSLDGNKLIQNAHNIVAAVQEIGGATKLTEAEKGRLNATLTRAIEKYQVLGKEAPTAMVNLEKATRTATGPLETLGNTIGVARSALLALGVTVSAGAILRAGQEALAYGDNLQALSAKTNISVESLQVMERMAQGANTTLDVFSNSALELSRRLAGGDTSAASAARALGLDIDRLLAMRPDAAFAEVAVAIGRVADEGDKAALAQDLMGKSARDLLPLMITGYREAAAEARNAAIVVSDEHAKALAEAQKTYDTFFANVHAGWVSLVATVIEASKNAPDGIAPTVEQLNQLRSAALSTYGDIQLSSEEAATAQVSHADLIAAKLQGLRDGYYKPLTEEVRIQVLSLKEYGAGNQEIVELLKVTEGQIRRVTEEQRLEAESTQRSSEEWKAYTDSVTKAVAAHDAAIASLSNRLFGYDDIERAKQYMEALGGVENVTMLSADAQAELAKVMAAGLEAMLRAGAGTDEMTSKMETFRLAATQSGRDAAAAFAQIQAQASAAAAATAAAAEGLLIIGQSPHSPLGAAKPSGVTAFPGSTAGQPSGIPGGVLADYYKSLLNAKFGVTQPRAGGGEVAAGQRYLVGELGPELFVPGASGAIVPSGVGSTITIAPGAVQINYPLMNDPRARMEIAEMVGDALMARMRQGGFKAPSGA